MHYTESDLQALKTKRLRELIREVNQAPLGFDQARDERTSSKYNLIQTILFVQATGELPEQPNEQPEIPQPMDQPQQSQQSANNPAQQLFDAVQSVANSSVDESRVIDLINTHARGTQSTITVDPNGQKLADVEGHLHPECARVAQLVSNGLNVLLTGPAGCGKTRLASDVARLLDRPFGHLSYTAGASEAWLLGRMLPTGANGQFELQKAQFATLYQQPSVFLHDEIDAADPNLLVIINSALANGGFTNPMTGTHLAQHAQAAQIASANTFGTGADSMYTAREALDAATLDRFYAVPMDYDMDYESSLGDANDANDLIDWVWDVRKRSEQAGLQRVVSTRWIQQGIMAANAGDSLDTIQRTMLAGWSDDEKQVIQ